VRWLEQRWLVLIVLIHFGYDAQISIGLCEAKVCDQSLDGRTNLIGKLGGYMERPRHKSFLAPLLGFALRLLARLLLFAQVLSGVLADLGLRQLCQVRHERFSVVDQDDGE
jgi:hypothetical protein